MPPNADAPEPPQSGPDPLPREELSSLRPPSILPDLGLSVLLALGYGSPLVIAGAAILAAGASHFQSQAGVVLGGIAAIGVAVVLSIAIYRNIRGERFAERRAKAVLFGETLILGFLPAWGLVYSHFLGHEGCEVSSCGAEDTVFRPFAEPEIFGLIAFHLVTVMAYSLSRRRPKALRPLGEVLLHATLLAGIVVQIAVGVHVARWIPVGLLLAPVFMPTIAPVLTVILYGAELRTRLRRRGQEAAVERPYLVADSPFRQGPLQEPSPPAPRIHRRLLAAAFAAMPAILGLHAVIHALWLGRADGALQVITRTCGHVLSQVPIVVLQEDCHYLCTVAARGHEWLVRPERLGRRRGVPIVVNRQLAIANAFEDLLHERWPRFGRFARRAYDRLGFPISRYLHRKWLADLTYLAMKPAEWLFTIVLLFLDRGDPEARIDRMYR